MSAGAESLMALAFDALHASCPTSAGPAEAEAARTIALRFLVLAAEQMRATS